MPRYAYRPAFRLALQQGSLSLRPQIYEIKSQKSILFSSNLSTFYTLFPGRSSIPFRSAVICLFLSLKLRSEYTLISRSKWLILPLLLCSATVISLLLSSPIVGHDSWLHLIWLEQFAGLIQEGVIYPRWLHLSNGGLGSPTFYFYPPLAAYLGSLLALVSTGAQEINLFRFVGYIGTLGSILSFRYYLKSLGIEGKLSWLGSLVYATLPYRAVDLVLRSALGEHLAFIWIPLLFAGVERALNARGRPGLKPFVLIAVSFGLLLLSNIPTSIIIAIAVPVYALVRTRQAMPVLRTAVGLIAGAVLAAFYLLPALSTRAHSIAPSLGRRHKQDGRGIHARGDLQQAIECCDEREHCDAAACDCCTRTCMVRHEATEHSGANCAKEEAELEARSD
jgi:hypothetical protein